ncbi:cellulose biosynthesis protein BcsD [Roseomonas sp. E05]|uniref:cellulose biosynthesis protein BcsD n=1 Tax=Roseomonas sp. E05 TaxID=3046310 RepID=UPI0024B8A2DF|nr:cellulose biosynthesis protein BcsD [Roseomonas sp. E05]MDJ0388682.1 cellulose biosynthesis protein BcsD [Roseomonas sp. E05]
MTETDQAALSYLARRDVSVQWRGFMRALLETLGAHLDEATRGGLLRSVGGQMAAGMPLRAASTLAELEVRMNDALAAIAWGYVGVALDEADHSLRLTHRAAPAIGAPGDEAGRWVTAVLEGLYGAWLGAQQGDSAGGASLRTVHCEPGLVVLRYGQ